MTIFQNIPADIEFECVKCNSCGCHYNGSENNRHGYFNCCYECGENKYEDECIIQKENSRVLPFEMIAKILNIRMESKKDDRYKNNFNAVAKSIDELDQVIKCKATFVAEYPNDFEHDSTSRLYEIPRYHNGVFMLEKIRMHN